VTCSDAHRISIDAFLIRNNINNINNINNRSCILPESRLKDYPANPAVNSLLGQCLGPAGRYLEMDTYYFTTARFLNALEWYKNVIPTKKLGVSVMNRDDLTADGLAARFYAIEQSKAEWVNVFMLPAKDEWLPHLKRWKTGCKACGVLACYDLDAPCGSARTPVPVDTPQ